MNQEGILKKYKKRMIIQICLFVVLSITINVMINKKLINSNNEHNNVDYAVKPEHNSQFIDYEGILSGAYAKALYNSIAEVNRDYKEDGYLLVKLSINGEPTIIPMMPYDNKTNNILNNTTNQMIEKSEYSDAKNKLFSGKIYKVWFEYEQDIITTIHIDEYNSKKGGS